MDRGNDQQDIPEGFTLSMALADTLPVLFFAMSAAVLSIRFPSPLFRLGAVMVILAGALKASWKFVIALAKRNVPLLSRQMRILMPAGFALCLLSLWMDRQMLDMSAAAAHIARFPSWLFFALGAGGIVCMAVFARTGSRDNAGDNWKEQIVNACAQCCIFLGILL